MVAQATTMNNILTQFGFTENEHKVYVGIYKNPLSTGSDIARKLRMDKSSTYKAVESLMTRGFLVSSEGQRGVVYEAINPESLKELYSTKKLQLEHDKGILDEFVKNLSDRDAGSRSFNIVVEHGVDAFKIRMNESLSCKEKLIRERWDYHPEFADEDYVRFADEYAHKRVELGIFLRTSNSHNDKVYQAFKRVLHDKKKRLKEVRITPETIQDTNIMRIWDETVNILSFDGKEDFIVVTIKDHYLAEMMKNYYDFVWSRSEKSNPGV